MKHLIYVKPPEPAKLVILYLPSGIPKLGILTHSGKYLTTQADHIEPEYWADIPT